MGARVGVVLGRLESCLLGGERGEEEAERHVEAHLQQPATVGNRGGNQRSRPICSSLARLRLRLRLRLRSRVRVGRVVYR